MQPKRIQLIGTIFIFIGLGLLFLLFQFKNVFITTTLIFIIEILLIIGVLFLFVFIELEIRTKGRRSNLKKLSNFANVVFIPLEILMLIMYIFLNWGIGNLIMFFLVLIFHLFLISLSYFYENIINFFESNI